MKTFRAIGAFFLVALVFLFGHQRVSAEIFNRVVAIVNDDLITLYELNQRIREMTGLTAEDLRDKDERRYLEARKQILELMIDEKCAEEKVRELGIKIPPQQIDAAIETIKDRNRWTQEDLMAMLKQEGLTYEEYRNKIKTDLERFELINNQIKSKIIIREEQIAQYYKENEKDYSSEETVQLAGIFLIQRNPKDEEESRRLKAKGEEILARLKNGEDFAALAKEFSQGPGANEGGDLGAFKADQLEPELRKAVAGIEAGKFTDLIVRANGIQIIKLIKRQKAQARPLEEVKDAIHAKLYQEEVNRRYMAWIKELRKETFTKIIF
ncbi:MAG: SurA N-terminal domain-containing protein [Deltaproteobacteria bacterium]|nr:MAG: SurA N-terminal domain-containing protein [Deltaproteobacteria bacterium]